MTYTVLNMILLISGIQGILFTTIIFSAKRFREKSNHYLALLILCFALNNLQYYFLYSGIASEELFYSVIYLPYDYIDVVFFYFYIKTFLFPDKAIQQKEKWLYFPFLLVFAITLYFKIGHAIRFLSENAYKFLDQLEFINEVSSLTFSIVLFFLSYNLIIHFEKKQTTYHSKKLKINLGWLKTLFLCMFLATIIWIIAFIEEILLDVNNSMFYYFLWVALSVIIYILGHVGLYKFGILTERKNIRKLYADKSIKIEVETARAQNEYIIAFERYVKEDKNYLNSQLSLDMVADEIKINKSYLSRLINSELKISFSNYVNQLRVEEMKIYINNPDFSHYNLTAMGLEAGFNSKSSFSKAFKKHTGLTPSQFKKNKKTEKKEVL